MTNPNYAFMTHMTHAQQKAENEELTKLMINSPANDPEVMDIVTRWGEQWGKNRGRSRWNMELSNGKVVTVVSHKVAPGRVR